MYLRSITLKGFKSFPERTKLEFGPGVSVIVGPNGSGKSNVTDAVLWALGEQSPAAVRGQVMQDVIFAGATGRQGSRQAEVELVLDDSEGHLGLGTAEVSVVRRLDRSGDGEYRLAGARCRLVDVIEMLSETGLGKEMHSVISQGRVESIISSKPRDRRMLIEEAAGLGKHRKRRRRAQLKLERTQDNLDRALDVEREARTRLRPLKRQAEAAELHARLARQALQSRWELARDDLRSRLEALEQAQAQAGSMRARREQIERELEQVARRREAAEEALAARGARHEALSRRTFAARTAGERVGDRGEAVRASAASLRARLARIEQQLSALGQEEDHGPAEAQARERTQALEAELALADREREQELEAALTELEARQAEIRARVAELELAVGVAADRRREAEQLLEDARAGVHQAQRTVQQARFEAARVGSELAAVNQFLRGTASAEGSAPRLAEQLEVDSGYELAVAAALDGRLGAAVVADLDAAQTVLDRIGAEGGRALIMGLSGATSGGTGDRPPADPPTDDADWLAGHVRGLGEAARLARSLLAQTWVLGGFDGLPPGFRGIAVTLEGRVLSTGAAELRQAPAVGQERILAQRNRREDLIRESESAASAELAAGGGLERAEAEHEAAQSALERAVSDHRAAVRARDDAAEDQRQVENLIDRRRSAPDDGPAEARRRAVAAELRAEHDTLARLERERVARAGHIERLRVSLSAGRALVPEVEALVQALDRAGEAIALQRTSFEESLAADRQAGEQVTAELRACAQDEAPLQAQLHRVGEELTESEVALQRVRDRTEETERELAQLAQELGLEAGPAEQELSGEEREALESRVERLARRREQIGPVNPLAEQEYADAVAHVEELEHQRTDLETALRELEKLISDTDREIRETFERTFAAAAENFEQVAGQLFPGGRGRLRLVNERDRPARVLGGQAPPEESPEAESEEEELRGESEEDRLGVEIEINPAGKEMTRLSLLSGGEKSLTALAFLFAVFLAKPCPFYILDEVEAALDDLNMDRFLTMLRTYAQQAQFIVVTHQRRTMEAADYLYGVSMGSDGVSKVISRRLDAGAGAATEAEAAA